MGSVAANMADAAINVMTHNCAIFFMFMFLSSVFVNRPATGSTSRPWNWMRSHDFFCEKKSRLKN
jgi:hypothetical protein